MMTNSELRDAFAGEAIQSLLLVHLQAANENSLPESIDFYEPVARAAYAMADAMLKTKRAKIHAEGREKAAGEV
jgi:hypothetical protein